MSQKTRLIKRVLDLGGTLPLLILLAPVIALCALLVKLQDRGPAFYRRRVVGPDGEFDAFKLRTMRPDAEAVLECDPVMKARFAVNSKLRHDPRITPVGAVLRKLSLDELPQLWNVLRGEMSLVGPRMITPAELTRYGDAAWIFRATRPGITGFWQVRGRQEVPFERRVEMDVYYVQNWSFRLDCQILLETPLAVIRGVGAY